MMNMMLALFAAVCVTGLTIPDGATTAYVNFNNYASDGDRFQRSWESVNDGCFKAFDDVPKYAMTLTCPTLMRAIWKFCIVPAPTKAEAVMRTLNWEINEKCPATILRRNDNATLYLETDSAARIS